MSEHHVCNTCGDVFGAPVWECPLCGYHGHIEDEECGDCHMSVRPAIEDEALAEFRSR